MAKFTWKMRNVLKRMKNQIFRFLFFELWSILFTIFKWITDQKITLKKYYQKWPNLQEKCAMYWNKQKFNFLIFNFLNMVNFVLKFRKKIMLRGPAHLKPPFLWGALPPIRDSTPRTRMLLDWIPLAIWLSGITG